jgi:phytol kinase
MGAGVLPLAPLPGMALVSVACGLLLGLVSWWKRAGQPPAELTRKAVHVGMGVIALSLPWVFADRWPVPVLCVGMGLAFVALKRFARGSDLGAAMHDVDRVSLGDLYFAMSVGALWLLSNGDRLLFVVPMLVLTLGDAVAALVGVRYGQRRFDGEATGKSLEGSAALFIVTCLSVHLPLVLSERVDAMAGILIAGTMAVLVVLLEAVAWRGLDNIFVPLGAFVALRSWLPLGPDALAWRLALSIGLLTVVVVARRRATLRDRALAGAVLFGYLAGALEDWRWLVAPGILFIAYTRLFPQASAPGPREHDTTAVAGVAMPAVAWLFAARVFEQPALFVPYTATFVAQLAMIGVVYASPRTPGGDGATLARVILTGAVPVLPAFLVYGTWPRALAAMALSLVGAAVAGVAINHGVSGISPGLDEEAQWMRQARWALVASMAVLPVVFF